jgi:hypothetical protein
VLRVVESWLRRDFSRRVILDTLTRDPERGGAALAEYLQTLDQQTEASPALTTTVSGAAQVGTIFNIARFYLAQTVQSTSPVALGELPPDIVGFTGRNRELSILKGLVCGKRKQSPPIVCVTSSQAGIGKSALAVHFAHQLALRYPYARLYASLGGATEAPLTPGEVLRMFLGALGLPSQNLPGSTEQLAAMYRSQLAGRPALILLDDVVDAAQVSLLRVEGPSLTLITSRQELHGLPTASTVYLGKLDPPTAVKLLARLYDDERVAKEPEAAYRVTRLCDYLPLAVRIAATTLHRKPDWRVADLAGRLAAQRQPFLGRGGDHGLRASLVVSLLELSPQDVRTYRLLGLLPTRDFTCEIAATLVGTDESSVKRTLDSLVGAHLLDVAPPSGSDRFRCVLPMLAREQAEVAMPARESTAALLRLCAWSLDPTRSDR